MDENKFRQAGEELLGEAKIVATLRGVRGDLSSMRRSLIYVTNKWYGRLSPEFFSMLGRMREDLTKILIAHLEDVEKELGFERAHLRLIGLGIIPPALNEWDEKWATEVVPELIEAAEEYGITEA